MSEQPWKNTPVGQFAKWMTPDQRPEYQHTPFRHWVHIEGSCEHGGGNWHRAHIGEAVIRPEGADDERQGYRSSDIAAIEKAGDMDPGTGIVTHWIPWGNFWPVPS